jgi:hypothetical protein
MAEKKSAPTPPPPGWGEDELTQFIQASHDNQHATFFRKREAVALLIAIDAEFAKVTKDWLNPQSEVVAMLFVRCHAAFRAAAAEAMAGQAVESYRQCRGMMENAAYALHIHRDAALATVWLNRHQDEASFKASKRAFRHDVVVESVTAANQHASARFEELYQRTIDWGGHPNERSVTGSMKMVKEPDRRVMLAVMLHGDDAALAAALKSVAQCAMVSLEMLQAVYNAKFELLGIHEAMLNFRKVL